MAEIIIYIRLLNYNWMQCAESKHIFGVWRCFVSTTPQAPRLYSIFYSFVDSLVAVASCSVIRAN